jgi:hypothetical protein
MAEEWSSRFTLTSARRLLPADGKVSGVVTGKTFVLSARCRYFQLNSQD